MRQGICTRTSYIWLPCERRIDVYLKSKTHVEPLRWESPEQFPTLWNPLNTLPESCEEPIRLMVEQDEMRYLHFRSIRFFALMSCSRSAVASLLVYMLNCVGENDFGMEL